MFYLLYVMVGEDRKQFKGIIGFGLKQNASNCNFSKKSELLFGLKIPILASTST